MDNITAILVAVITSNLIVEIFKAVFGRKSSEDKKFKILSDSVQAILREMILDKCEKYIEKGFIYHKQLGSLISLYTNYKALGGNGFVDEEMELVKELPRHK